MLRIKLIPYTGFHCKKDIYRDFFVIFLVTERCPGMFSYIIDWPQNFMRKQDSVLSFPKYWVFGEDMTIQMQAQRLSVFPMWKQWGANLLDRMK